MKLGALLLFSALLANAQAPFEIRGSVVEPGLGGIAGAEVRAQGQGGRTAQYLSAFTDARGEFVIRTTTPGAYILEPMREGYVLSIRSEAAIGRAIVDANRPSATVQLTMSRPAEIAGRVLDAETHEPMEGIDIFILQKAANGSGWNQTISFSPTSVLGNASARTDARGNFAAKGLLPGAYVASAIRQQGTTWSAEYSPGDLNVVDQTAEMLFWPGGTPPELARPIPVGSGAVVSFGDLLLKKVPHYRAHVSLEQGSCPPGESMRVSISGQPLSDQQPKAFPCGSELLLRDLMPGTYHLYAVSDWQGVRDNVETAAWATADFVVEDKNVEVLLTPHAGVVLEGQVIVADGVSLPDAYALGVRPLPISEGFRPGPEQFLDLLEGGKFRMAVAPLPQSFVTNRYFQEAYIKEVRYNGSPLQAMTLDVNPGAAAQRIEILLDNKFGSLSGTVAGGERNSRVVVSLWSEGAESPEGTQVVDGAFMFPKLVPGDYRVGAVAMAADAYRQPSAQDAKQTVTIRPGETTTINVSAPASPR